MIMDGNKRWADLHGASLKEGYQKGLNKLREIMDSIKKDEKDKKISQDEMKKKSTEVQKITDEFISKIDLMTSKKQTEILKV